MTRPRGDFRWLVVLAALSCGATMGLVVWLTGCTNDPFDPESIPNKPPVAKVFISAVETDSLNPTSYYNRTFYWSGSDEDGFVEEFFVSIGTQSNQAAPWDTTTSQDTTLTFNTDDDGHAEAYIQVVCRDDRGALSDTVSQFIPLRNFPPIINFQDDFDPANWSYSAANFRFFAVDFDGNETMADSFLYRLDSADTTIVRDFNDPDADPALGWVRKAFDDLDLRTMTVELHGIASSSDRALTVSITDEAAAETRFVHQWNVREAKSPVLVVADGVPFIDEFYFAAMDTLFGIGEWSRWELLYRGLPDEDWIFLETLRQFPVVLWYTGPLASPNLVKSRENLSQYLRPDSVGIDPGQLLLMNKNVIGVYGNLPKTFVEGYLGVSDTPDPPLPFYIPDDKQALGLQPWLPAFTTSGGYGHCVGLQPMTFAESLYQLEYCFRCYEVSTDPNNEPFVAVRTPTRATDPIAKTVVVSMQLEYFERQEAITALIALLTQEMGVTAP